MGRRHRGAAPRDRELFAAEHLPALRAATEELSWLLTRGYSERSALELVGNRHELTARQRKAVGRCACSDEARSDRRSRRRPLGEIEGAELHVDGFNALIVAESVLGGGPVLVGRDLAHRDLASVHGSYRRVQETREVIDELGRLTERARAVVFWLDRPVSNSGRLAALLLELGREHGWPWRAEVVWDPDAVLRRCEFVVATGDAGILDSGVRWIDLPAALAGRHPRRAWLIDLSGG